VAKILAITNQKGGVGKTTTGVNLAASLAATRQRVLLVDLDPQGNATMGSGIDKRTLKQTVYHVLLGETEIELVDINQRETRLKSALATFEGEYDFILIDCPPSLNLLTVNGLCAAQAVLIPMQCEYYALEGLSDLVQTVKKVRAHLNPQLEIEGLLRTMFDPRNTLAQQVSAQLQQHFGDKVYRTVIPRNVRLAEAPSYGVPALGFDKTSKGAQAYLALAGEMLNRVAQGV
jgi:chromosome partitioning protein